MRRLVGLIAPGELTPLARANRPGGLSNRLMFCSRPSRQTVTEGSRQLVTAWIW